MVAGKNPKLKVKSKGKKKKMYVEGMNEMDRIGSVASVRRSAVVDEGHDGVVVMAFFAGKSPFWVTRTPVEDA